MKSKPKPKQITIRFTEEQYAEIEKLSLENDVSIATVVRWTVKEYFK